MVRTSWSWLFSGALLAVACGGESSGKQFTGDDGGGASSGTGGSGGSSAGGADGSGGSSTGGAGQSGSGGATGGVTGSGGSPASGGSPGSGGTPAADGGGCAPPANASNAALCLTVLPEDIAAENDPALDLQGIYAIQVFDTPNPPRSDAGRVALAERVLPRDAATGGEVAVTDVRPLRLEGAFPDVVYVRVLFVDDARLLTAGSPFGPGVWVGGMNLADGIQENEPLIAVPVTRGQGTALDVPLVAFRSLTVTVHTSATPIGDGQGRLPVAVVNNPDPSKKPPAFGYGELRCADVTQGDVDVTAAVVGHGPYWVAGVLHDLGGPGDLPEGSIASLAVTAAGIRIPARLDIAPRDYTPTARIDLSYVVPLGTDAGSVGANSCADLGLLGDAGP